MYTKTIFIAGTDTAAGKTFVTVALMQALKARGKQVYGLKPVASGCRTTDKGLVSDDAILIQQNCSQILPYKTINPVALANPCSPDIAARLENRTVALDEVIHAYKQMPAQADFVLIEGIGGWRTPFCETAGMSDLVKLLAIPVILVVGLRLGCINHALLTVEAMRNDGVKLAGWVATRPDPDFNYVSETIACLAANIGAPMLAQIPLMNEATRDEAGVYFNLGLLHEEIMF